MQKQSQEMKKVKILPRGNVSSHKIGEFEFMSQVIRLPLCSITKRVRVTIELKKPQEDNSTWGRTLIVKNSEADEVIQMFISNYLAEVGFFKIA